MNSESDGKPKPNQAWQRAHSMPLSCRFDVTSAAPEPNQTLFRTSFDSCDNSCTRKLKNSSLKLRQLVQFGSHAPLQQHSAVICLHRGEGQRSQHQLVVARGGLYLPGGEARRLQLLRQTQQSWRVVETPLYKPLRLICLVSALLQPNIALSEIHSFFPCSSTSFVSSNCCGVQWSI